MLFGRPVIFTSPFFFFFPSARPGPGQPHLFVGVYTGGRQRLPAGQESSRFALEHASVVSQSGLLISERAEGRRAAARTSSFRAPLFFRNNEPDISPSSSCSSAASHARLRASSHLFFFSASPRFGDGHHGNLGSSARKEQFTTPSSEQQEHHVGMGDRGPESAQILQFLFFLKKKKRAGRVRFLSQDSHQPQPGPFQRPPKNEGRIRRTNEIINEKSG